MTKNLWFVWLVLVSLLAITAISLVTAVQANAGICLNITQHQKREIVSHYKQLYPGDTIDAGTVATQHDKDAQYVIRVYSWPHLVHTVIIPLKNSCATHI